jgi:hypothetical protein
VLEGTKDAGPSVRPRRRWVPDVLRARDRAMLLQLRRSHDLYHPLNGKSGSTPPHIASETIW